MSTPHSPIRYAVVGLGYISQVAVLPAFAHARSNSRLAALVSGDASKRKSLSGHYRVPAYSYEDYPALLKSGTIDAVYIALPNELHKDYAVQAAEAGIHILCEKPLAVTSEDAAAMVNAAQKHHVHLMTAYRLHFEKANLTAVSIARSGVLGDLRFFSSIFSLPVKEGDIRVQKKLGGGSVYDLGIYCINAARYLFGAEPTDAMAISESRPAARFKSVDEMTGGLLRFPGDRMASFTSSLGAADTGSYVLVGTQGSLCADPAYEYAERLRLYVTLNGKTKKYIFPKRDQFAAELIYFSDCIRMNREPEPSGKEGWKDVRIIEAIYRSAQTKRWVGLPDLPKSLPSMRPTLRQEIHRPPVIKPELVHASSASGER